jgi:hypothetical protein
MSRSMSMIVLLCTMIALSAVAERSRGEEKPAAEAKIEKALSQPTSFEFKGQALQEVVNYLKETHGVEIVLDKRAFSDEGIDPETPVTFARKNTSLRSALDLMLQQLDLTFAVYDETLVITTETAAAQRLDTKVYTVTDLIDASAKSRKKLRKIIKACVAPESWSSEDGAGSIFLLTLGDRQLLVVSQTYAVHHEIAALLEKLRTAAFEPKSDGEK